MNNDKRLVDDASISWTTQKTVFSTRKGILGPPSSFGQVEINRKFGQTKIIYGTTSQSDDWIFL